MVYWSLIRILTPLLDFFTILGVTNRDKDLETLILRQQVQILQRKVKTPPRITDPERMIFAILSSKFSQSKKDARQQLHLVMLIIKPDTVLRWHRELVWRKWIFRRKGTPGRPKITSELEALIARLAKENSRWGYDRIQGEMLKPGHRLVPFQYAISSSNIGSYLHQNDRLDPGVDSWGIIKNRSWLAISSPWRRSGSRPSAYCFSLSWVLDVSILLDA